jgi:ABC-type multidrug transport system fused ATPase/permease subunit
MKKDKPGTWTRHRHEICRPQRNRQIHHLLSYYLLPNDTIVAIRFIGKMDKSQKDDTAAKDSALPLSEVVSDIKQPNDPHHLEESTLSPLAPSRRELLSFVWKEIRSEWSIMCFGASAMLVSSAANQALPRCVGRFIDRSSSANSTSDRALYTQLGAVVLLGSLASFLRTGALQIASERIASRLRRTAWTSILLSQHSISRMVETTIHEENDRPQGSSTTITEHSSLYTPATIASIFTNDVPQMSEMMTSGVVNLLRSTSATLFSMGQMIALNPYLLLTTVTLLPTVGLGTMMLSKRMKRLGQRQQSMIQQSIAFVEERITHLHLVKQYHRTPDEIRNYQHLEATSSRFVVQYAMYNGMRMGFMFLSTATTLLFVIYRGTVCVRSNRMTGGQLTSFSTYAFLFGLGTAGILKNFQEMQQAGWSSTRRYYQLLQSTEHCWKKDANTELIPPHQNTVSLDMNSVTSLEVQNLSFAYKHDHFVLRDITMSVPRGKVVALVGHNGAGKSTLVHLLAGLYEPTQGSIRISAGSSTNNVGTQCYDIRSELDIPTQNKLVQVVSQTTSLLNMSIYENIRYSHPEASLMDVEMALYNANAMSIVESKKYGIHCVVGRNGDLLSGGERQKIALARAMVLDPLVLILDESTTSMDTEGTNALHEMILRQRETEIPGKSDGTGHNGIDSLLSCQRGILIITHQAKTLLDLNVDYVYVMKNGRIAEEGTVEHLRSNDDSELCSLMPTLRG